MTEKRFDYVLNEFDEVEYISDNIDCEDRDFADFIDYANQLAKENEQLRQLLEYGLEVSQGDIDDELRRMNGEYLE